MDSGFNLDCILGLIGSYFFSKVLAERAAAKEANGGITPPELRSPPPSKPRSPLEIQTSDLIMRGEAAIAGIRNFENQKAACFAIYYSKLNFVAHLAMISSLPEIE